MGIALCHCFSEKRVILEGRADLQHVINFAGYLLVDYFFEIIQFSDRLFFQILGYLSTLTLVIR